jgi:hypothetical protein
MLFGHITEARKNFKLITLVKIKVKAIEDNQKSSKMVST